MEKQEYEALKKIGKTVMVHAYKFNGWLYRSWEYPMIIANEDDYVVLSNFNTEIMTSEYNSYRVFCSQTKLPSFWVFFKEHWFNLLITIVNNKPQYYINVSSKFIYEESAIKYIDFDLDYRILSDGTWMQLDRNEYLEAIKLFKYPKPLTARISEVEQQIEDYIRDGYFMKTFNMEKLNNYIKIYNDYQDKNNYEK